MFGINHSEPQRQTAVGYLMPLSAEKFHPSCITSAISAPSAFQKQIGRNAEGAEIAEVRIEFIGTRATSDGRGSDIEMFDPGRVTCVGPTASLC